jgi:ligand-binding sensor domain-containing protein
MLPKILLLIGAIIIAAPFPTIIYAQSATVVQVINTDNSPLPNNSVNTLLLQGNTLWIGTEDGLAQVAMGTGQWQVYNTANSQLSDNRVRSLARHNDQLLIGTFIAGLCTYDGITWTNYNTDNSDICDNYVRCIQPLPNSNTVWLGTTGGIAAWNTAGNTWATYFSNSPDLTLNNVGYITFDSNNIAWIGTLNAGLIGLENNGEGFIVYTTYNMSGIPDNTINHICLEPNGKKWLTTAFHGLVSLDTANQWSVFDPSNSPLTTTQLTALLRDTNGNLLIGSFDKGLFIANMDNNTWLHLDSNNSPLPDNQITHIVAQNDSTVWVGTQNGGIARIVYRDFVTALPPAPQAHNNNNAQLLVYPNPAQSGNTLQLAYAAHNKPIALSDTEIYAHNPQLRLRLFNILAQPVAELPLLPNSSAVQLPPLLPGIYYLQITTPNRTLSAKLLVQP